MSLPTTTHLGLMSETDREKRSGSGSTPSTPKTKRTLLSIPTSPKVASFTPQDADLSPAVMAEERNSSSSQVFAVLIACLLKRLLFFNSLLIGNLYCCFWWETAIGEREAPSVFCADSDGAVVGVWVWIVWAIRSSASSASSLNRSVSLWGITVLSLSLPLSPSHCGMCACSLFDLWLILVGVSDDEFF